jgi:HEAT repeat protein
MHYFRWGKVAIALSFILTLPLIAAHKSEAQSQRCNTSEIEQHLEQLEESPSAAEVDRLFALLLACDSQAVAPLIDILRDDDYAIKVRQGAAKALGQIGSEKAVAALIKEAKNTDSAIRDSVLEAIAYINPQAQASAALLLRDITLTDDQTLLQALSHGLGRISAHEPEQFPSRVAKFYQALDRQNQFVQNTARSIFVSALGQGNVNSQTVMSFLLTTLEQDDNEFVRAATVDILSQVHPDTQIIIPQFVRILGQAEETGYVKAKAAAALGQIGADAINPVIAALEQQEINSYWWSITLIHLYRNPSTQDPVIHLTLAWIRDVREHRAKFNKCRFAEFLWATEQTEALEEVMAILETQDKACFGSGGLQSGGQQLLTVARNATKPIPIVCRLPWISRVVGRCR